MIGFFIIFISSILLVNVEGVSFTPYLADNAILQRGSTTKASVYGDGASGTVTVRVQSTGASVDYSVTATVESGGYWRALLNPTTDIVNTYTITVEDSGSSGETISNVKFGDVYIYTGQSNMVLRILATFAWTNTQAEINAGDFSDLKFSAYYDGSGLDDQPQETVSKNANFIWKTANEIAADSSLQGVDGISAIQLYSAMQMWKLYDQYSIQRPPIGIIIIAFGGANLNRWHPNVGEFCPDLEISDTNDGFAYNTYIHPIRKMTISGMAYYQGEADENTRGSVEFNTAYACEFPEMIKSYRTLFSSEPDTTPDDFPFVVVTLTTALANEDEYLPSLRMSQLSALQLENVFSVHTFDTGDPYFENNRCRSERCCGRPGENPLINFGTDCIGAPYSCDPDSIDGQWCRNYVDYNGMPVHSRLKRRTGYRVGSTFFMQKNGNALEILWHHPKLYSCVLDTTNQEVTFHFDTGTDSFNNSIVQVDYLQNYAIQYCKVAGATTEEMCDCPFWEPNSAGASNNIRCLPNVNSHTYSSERYRDNENPSFVSWENIPSPTITIAPSSITIGGIDTTVRTMRYAWLQSPCCDQGNDFENGLIPCPPANCMFYTVEAEMNPDPFFVSLDHVAGTCTIPTWQKHLTTGASPTTFPTTKFPTLSPTHSPVPPTIPQPSKSPSAAPSSSPSATPSNSPSQTPSKAPSGTPTTTPTRAPTTGVPSKSPSKAPSKSPTTPIPSQAPSTSPTRNPTKSPTKNPTNAPSISPTLNPTGSPIQPPTLQPTDAPVEPPTPAPTLNPDFVISLASFSTIAVMLSAIVAFIGTFFLYRFIKKNGDVLDLASNQFRNIRREPKKRKKSPPQRKKRRRKT